DIGAETHRQAVERYLHEKLNYPLSSIGVDVPLSLSVAGETYETQLDLVVAVSGQPVMVIKCAAGSLESREKEIIAAARIMGSVPVPYAVVSDGKTAVVYDALSRQKIAEGLEQIPSYEAAREFLKTYAPAPLPEDRREREKIIFKSYDSMNMNVQRYAGCTDTK
ncbi:MAG: type I restriction enzyme HsdR N-terminal domain-containing protein, partial [Desulfobacterales bacterium]